jgi:hypothetical protein
MLTPPSFLANIHDGGHSVSGLPPHVDALAVDGGVHGVQRAEPQAAGEDPAPKTYAGAPCCSARPTRPEVVANDCQ